MISRKMALEAGKKLNAAAAVGVAPLGLPEAVRIANEVMFQYYLIPRAIREEYYREELAADGVRVQAVSEE